jgi:hypothetical protein
MDQLSACQKCEDAEGEKCDDNAYDHGHGIREMELATEQRDHRT